MKEYGVTMKKAIEYFEEIHKLLPPLGQDDIEAIKKNPNMKIFQKWRLIRFIKRKG